MQELINLKIEDNKEQSVVILCKLFCYQLYSLTLIILFIYKNYVINK